MICARQQVNFDARYCPGGGACQFDPHSGAPDPSRALGPKFLKAIFEDPKYAPIVHSSPVTISGAILEGAFIVNATISSLDILHSRVNGTLEIDDTTLSHDLRIAESSVEGLTLTSPTAGYVQIIGSSIAKFQVYLADLDYIIVSNSSVQQFLIMNSRLANGLNVFGGKIGVLDIESSASNGLYLKPVLANAIGISQVSNKGYLNLAVEKWMPGSALILRNFDTDKFKLQGAGFPALTDLLTFDFGAADWGDAPGKYLDQLEGPGKHDYRLSLYDKLAASYADTSLPPAIMIKKSNVEYRQAHFLQRIPLFLSWMLAGYGYTPELGFLWIALFIIAGTLIFRYGERHLQGTARPRSWLVFSIDSVIPGIHLDPEHQQVSFDGWRQAFLYFLRFLGAVVVVIILALVRRSFSF